MMDANVVGVADGLAADPNDGGAVVSVASVGGRYEGGVRGAVADVAPA